MEVTAGASPVRREPEATFQDERVIETGARFLLYSHDGVGLGHTRRNLALAGAVTRLDPSTAVLLATGSQSVGRLGLPSGVDFLQLPSLRKESNGRYLARHLSIEADELFRLRSAILDATVRSFRPNVVLIDKHPLGANGELVTAIRSVKQLGGRLVLGLRDILDEPEAVRQEWFDAAIPEFIDRSYDQILIYGSRTVFDPVKEYGLSPNLEDRTLFCGYVLHGEGCDSRASDVPPRCMEQPRSRPVVLATVGGGEDGFPLLDAFMDAAESAAWQGVVVTGPLAAPEDRRKLMDMAGRVRMPVYTMVGGLAEWFSKVDAVVCMGGYNTLVEVLSSRTPAVCVPRVVPRQEQVIRAEGFSRLGLVRMLHPADLSPDSLRVEIDAALAQSRAELGSVTRRRLDFDGATTAARRLLGLAASTVPSEMVG